MEGEGRVNKIPLIMRGERPTLRLRCTANSAWVLHLHGLITIYKELLGAAALLTKVVAVPKETIL
jgi:hypothetical protein